MPMKNDRRLVILLRAIAVAAALAIVPIFMPHSWMEFFHRLLGLGALEETPIVAYLTRSLSAMYALHAGVLWIVSTDTRRYATLITYIGAGLTAFGATLIWIDTFAGLPWYWIAAEGPFTIALGLAILVFQRKG